MPIDLEGLIETVGYPGLVLCIFAETGLLVGFFLPGDTLLLSAGILARRGDLSIWWLLPLLTLAAIAGDSTGYAIGRRAGPPLFAREEGRFFRRDHLLRAKAFYERHGGKTILLARFIGFLRTFAPTVAGAVGMSYRRFVFFNIAGGALWVLSLTLLGYAVGNAVDNLDSYLGVIFGIALLLSVSPAIWHILRERRRRAAAGVPRDT